MSEFYTVGELRKLLEGLPDGKPICAQVVATNGQAWNLVPQFSGVVAGGAASFALLQMKHEELSSLQWPSVQQTCVHPFNRLGIDADGVMWCVECLTKPLVIPVPFGSPVNQGEPPR